MTDIDIQEGDFSAVTQRGLEPGEVKALVHRWVEGGCGAFAARMHELTGWPMFCLIGASGRVHFGVQRPDGTLVDAYGAYASEPLPDIAARCGESSAGWKPVDAEDWCASMSEEDRQEIDADLRHPCSR